MDILAQRVLAPSRLFLAWSASVELWFLGQGLSDHLTTSTSDVPQENRSQWERFDYQLCALLWQSVEPTILVNLSSFKTCSSFWRKTQSLFANDIQRLYDSAQKLASLKHSDHNMIEYVT